MGLSSGTGDTLEEKIRTGYGTQYTYNLQGKVITVLDPVSAERGLLFTTRFTYDAVGRTTMIESASGLISHMEYDSAGNITRKWIQENATAPEQTLMTATYDYVGNMQSQTDARGNTTTYSYNALGKLRETTLPGDATIPAIKTITQYTRTALPSVSWTDAGLLTSFTYDNLGHLLSVSKKDAKGNKTINTFFRYDLHGNLRFATDANGTVTEYTYDVLNQ